MVICVFGAASEAVDAFYKEKCYSLCKKLAERGHSLIYGAGSEGLMGAAARGFKDGGGKVHGIIPHFFKEKSFEGIYYDSDKLEFTETMAERKQKMEDGCDAFIVVPGGIGTFEEFFEVLTLKQLGRHKKAIAVYDIAGYYSGLDRMFDGIIKSRFVNEECKKLYKTMVDEKEVIDYIENYSAGDVDWNLLKRNVEKPENK